MPRYWKKELPDRPFYLQIGKPVAWDFIVDDIGYLHTEDGYINAQLLQAARSGIGGIAESGIVEYTEAAKKKAEQISSPQRRQERQTIGPASGQHFNRADVAVPVDASILGVMADGKAVSSFAAPQKPEGLKVDRQFVKPRVGRVSQ